jgi:hypothetical protein
VATAAPAAAPSRSPRRAVLIAAAALLAVATVQPSLRSVAALPAGETPAAAAAEAIARPAFSFPAPPPTIVWTPATAPAVPRAVAARVVVPGAEPEPSRSPAPPAPLPVIAPARVAIAVEHGLAEGRLRVWVDDRQTVDTALAGKRTKKLLVFNRSSGAATEVIDVPPGDRLLRFEVEGGGVVRRGLVRGHFESDRTRLLRVKVEGRTLDLDWRS